MRIMDFTALADRLMDQVPPELLEDLNGGISIRRRSMRRRDDPSGIYILGEYVTDILGNYIVLYYGSFEALFAGEPDEVWEKELWDTIRHELRHHIENRAGVADLDREDEAELEEFRRQPPEQGEQPPPARKFKLKRPLSRPE